MILNTTNNIHYTCTIYNISYTINTIHTMLVLLIITMLTLTYNLNTSHAHTHTHPHKHQKKKKEITQEVISSIDQVRGVIFHAYFIAFQFCI